MTLPPSIRACGAITGILFAMASAPAGAASLKSLMQNMGFGAKAAKGLLVSYDQAKADAMLRSLAADADAALALYKTGPDAKSKDLRARFAGFASTVAAARQSSSDRATFKAAFATIVGECRSCHSVYK